MINRASNFSLLEKEYSLLNQFSVALSVISAALYTVAMCICYASEYSRYGFWAGLHIIPFLVLLACAVAVNYYKKPQFFLFISQLSNVVFALSGLIFFRTQPYTNAYYETVRLLFWDSRYLWLSLCITFVFSLFALAAVTAGNTFWCRLYYSLNVIFYMIMFVYMQFDERRVESDIMMSASYLLYYISHLVFSFNLTGVKEKFGIDITKLKRIKNTFKTIVSPKEKLSAAISFIPLLIAAFGIFKIIYEGSSVSKSFAYMLILPLSVGLILSAFAKNKRKALLLIQSLLVVIELIDIIFGEGITAMTYSYLNVFESIFGLNCHLVMTLVLAIDIGAIFMARYFNSVWYSVYAAAKMLLFTGVFIRMLNLEYIMFGDAVVTTFWLLFYISLTAISFCKEENALTQNNSTR